MKKELTILIFLSTVILGISCQHQSKRVEPILQKAEQILDQSPDSALVVLDEITNAQKLKKTLYYQYYLLKIQAKYKSYEDISSDTLIFKIREYYKKKNKLDDAALAAFYGGRVYHEQNKYEKAMQQYLVAESDLGKSSNLNLKGLCKSAIGQVYYEQLLKREAIVYYKQAKEYFKRVENYKNEIIVTNQIGNCFLMDEKQDSAFFYYKQAHALAEEHKYRNQQASINISLGVAYERIKDWERAQLYYNEALILSDDSLDIARIYSNIAEMNQAQEKNDSAKYYLQQSLLFLPSEKFNLVTANIYKTWSAIEESESNYFEALAKYKLYNSHLANILTDNRNAAILEIEEKYNFQLVENKNKQLLIDTQRIILVSLVAILISVIIILAFYRRVAKREKELIEAEHKIMQLQKMADKFDENENSYRNVLISHFDLIKKAALVEKYLNEDERKKGQNLLSKFNQVVYGKKNLNWDLLFETLNKGSNGFFKQLKDKLSQLHETEFRICCLVYADFNNTEIALMLNYSLGTVEVKKSTIRKKLGIKQRGNIRDFIES